MESFAQIIQFFYRKIIQNHPLKPQLLKKLHTLLHTLKHGQGNTTHESHIRRNSFEETSMRLSKKQQFNENESIIRKGGEQWGCQWYLTAPKLPKILSYTIMHSLIAGKNIWQFQKLEEQLNILLENAHFGESVLRHISNEWSKLGQLIQRNKSSKWQKILVQSMKKMPDEFDQMILQCFKKDIVFIENTIENVDQYLKQISFQLKIRISYFLLDCKRIVSNQIYGLSDMQYNLGWVGSIKKYVLSDKVPSVTEVNRKKMDVLGQFKVNIAELVREFDENGKKLFQLSDINAYGKTEQKIMSFISGKN